MITTVQSRNESDLGMSRRGSAGRDVAAQRLSNTSFLIVDHLAHRARMMKAEMKALGMRRVEVCDDAAIASQILDTDTYEAAIVAYDLPHTDGPAFTRGIRAKSDPGRRKIPVVMVTADSSINAIRNAVNAGVDEFVVMPFSAKDLLTRIQRAVISPRPFVVTDRYVGPERAQRSGEPAGI